MAIYFHLLLQITIFLQILISLVTCTESVTKSFNSSGYRPQCTETERQALLHFKGNLTDSFGRLSSWVGHDCCNWEGVGCNNRTGNVVKLDLGTGFQEYPLYCRGSQLSGKLSPSLLDLNHLNYLNLSCNDFFGRLPSFIGSLQKLKYLDLSHTHLDQMVPLQLGNLSILHYLDLSCNNLWASDLNWLSGLNSLEYLNLIEVDLSKASASFSKAISFLPSLSELHLHDCSLEYPLSFSIENFTSLSVIDLSENRLISEIPPWLFNITTLVDLDLSNCNITLPVSRLPWNNFHKLEVLNFGSNSITDDIGIFIDILSKRSNITLRILSLDDNHFSGQLGESLGRLTNLTSLLLRENSISGEIPSSIGRLSFLEELFLPGNFMNGSIPESIGELSSLTELHLDSNYWTGKLSEVHFRKLRKLKSLYISSSDGALVFDMAPDWIPPFSLEQIIIDGCRLGPAFPPWIQIQTELNKITMSNAQISDTIPYWFWNLSTRQVHYLDLSGNEIGGVLPYYLEFQVGNNFDEIEVDLRNNNLHGPIPLWSNLSYLTLRNNSFSGPIPREIGIVMSPLSGLDLSFNCLNGTIPKSISKMEYLDALDLSNNKLSGKMLDKWDSLRYLEYLDLSKNYLFGKISVSICSSQSLSWLDLSDNSFHGALPLFLQNCTGLQGLNLRGNRLSGNIPPRMGESLESLQWLKLQRNKFSGEIPQELCHLPSLHAIDLSHNNLTGIIPPCFGNLSRLLVPAQSDYDWRNREMDFSVKGRFREFIQSLSLLNIIDLSNNNLIGELPEEISNLSFLGFLNLSRNQLTGIIPKNIGGIRQLETLDLSHNHLSGSIPSSLASLTFLDGLDLSFNNLSGQIPRANQFSTFNSSAYEGNPMLCGDPLLKSCFTRASEDSERDKDEKREGGKRVDDDEMFWFYVSLGMGFIVGFWGLLGSLAIKRSWRIALFRYFDGVTDKIFVFIAMKIARLKRKIETEEN